METLQSTISPIGDKAPFKKCLADEKKPSIKSQTEESNYADLSNSSVMKTDGTKTVKVTFTGEGSQLAVFKCQSDTSTVGDGSPGKRKEKGNITQTPSKDHHQDHSKNAKVGECESFVSSTSPDNEISASEMPTTETDPQTEIILQDYNPQNVSYESEELRYTDMYLNSQSESEDGSSSVVLSDQSTVNTFADESHYITTHEIQLTELDHDVDYEIGRGPCWDYEDDNLVYSFVDYASFESDETTESTLILDGKVGKAKISKGQSVNAGQRGTGRAPGSTESDVCDSDKCVSSDESICKHLNCGETSGQIHLSIETSSRAINAKNAQENETNCYRARRTGERSEYFFKGSDSSREAVFDRAHYFIPAPGRQHLAPQLKGKDINEYSSGASSSISELDDADKEVRNLTAKSFRSLACPYFDAINLSTSSESSISEHGIDFNKWSAMFDLNYGNMNHGREKRLISHRSSTFEVNKNPGCKNIVEVGDIKEAQTNSCSHKKQTRSNFQKESSSTKKIEIMEQYDDQGQGEMITLTETLNFSCNVEAGLPTCQRRAKCVENTTGSRSADEVTGIMPSRPGSAGANPHSDCGDTMDDTYKKAVFASSLLKNVISKKMQFEQERKMERGEIRDTHTAQSPCFQSGDPDTSKEPDHCKCEQRQESETDSGPVALHELGDVVDTLSNIDPREQQGQCATTIAEPTLESQGGVMCKSNKDICDTKAVTLPQSEKSAFKSYKDGEQSGNVEPGNDKEEVTTDMIPPTVRISEKHESPLVSGKLTKMSHLYVPSSHLLFKDREEEQHTQDKNIHDGVTEQGEDECSREKNLCNLHRSAVLQASKAPEIKIRLRSVKDNKSHPLNIANLLTPNIGLTSTYPLKVVSESKCQMPSASDRVPHFTVRDIRESKGKFQTPIHQVRDVRKLVKSSYRFVALENAENKAVSSTSLLSEVGLFKKEPDKKPPQSPMIIKCHSVNTNNARKQCRYAPETPKRGQVECPSELDRLSPKPLADSIRNDSVFATRSAGRTPCVKQPYVDSAELKMETKAVKQRQDKTVETVEKKSESKVTNQAALEKLKAAVKTMEQLYVFDRNEWKRKTQAPHPVTDSHVLSLITSEEQGGPTKSELEVELGKGFENERSLSSIINPPALASTLLPAVAHSTDDKVNFKLGIYGQEDTSTSKSFNVHAERFNNKCEVNVGSSLKTPVCSASSNNSVKQSCSAQQGIQPNSKTITHTFKKSPLSVNITSPKQEAEEKSLIKSAETSLQAQAAKLAQAETENYLTIPVKACPTDTSASSASTTASRKLGSPLESSQPGTSSQQMSLKRSPIIMESWAPESPTGTTIYHHSLPIPLAATAPQVFCIPPSLVSTVTDPMQQQQQQTQKKMLLDPTTGHYYLVDTPVQPATKRLYDPETGQYVDVPVPPPQPLTPVPMPISPLALSPGAAFAPTYMIYPGLMASPTAFTSQSLSSSTQSEGDAERLQGKDTGTQTSTGATYPLGHSPVARGVGAVPGTSGTKPPVISITAQQGPRIIAPPSFDGTTMSFVVEHR